MLNEKWEYKTVGGRGQGQGKALCCLLLLLCSRMLQSSWCMPSHSHPLPSQPSGFHGSHRFRVRTLHHALQPPALDLRSDLSSNWRESNLYGSRLGHFPRFVVLESLGGQRWSPLNCSGLDSPFGTNFRGWVCLFSSMHLPVLMDFPERQPNLGK